MFFLSFTSLASNTSCVWACSRVMWCVHNCTALYILLGKYTQHHHYLYFLRQDLTTSPLPWKWWVTIKFIVNNVHLNIVSPCSIFIFFTGDLLSTLYLLFLHLHLIAELKQLQRTMVMIMMWHYKGWSSHTEKQGNVSENHYNLRKGGEKTATLSSLPCFYRQTTSKVTVSKWRVKSYPNYRLVWKNSIQPALRRRLD